MLGVDVKVQDDGHKEMQQAEKEHSLADALQRPPQQSAHPAGGRRPAQWARASGCRPEQGGRETDPDGQGRMGKAGYPPPAQLLTLRDSHPHLPSHTLVTHRLTLYLLSPQKLLATKSSPQY